MTNSVSHFLVAHQIEIQGITAIVNVLFVTMTAVFTGVYAYLTFGMSKVMSTQLRVSVFPCIEISNVTDLNQQIVQFKVLNTGHGPAIVEEYSISVDDQKIQMDNQKWMDQVLKQLGVNDQSHGYHMLLSGDSIGAGSERILMESKGFPVNTSNEAMYLQIKYRVKIKITYRTLLGERASATN